MKLDSYGEDDAPFFECFDSPDSGKIKFIKWEDRFINWRNSKPQNKQSLLTPEIWALNYPESLEELKKLLIIKINTGRVATIKFILSTFNIVQYDK